MHSPSISAVIPMHNEAPYVGRCLPAVVEAIRDVTDDFEVIVVDDASTDGTGDLVREYGKKTPQVRCVTNEKNLTLGGTLRRGFDASTKELVFYTDADLPFDVGLLTKAVRLLRFLEADMVAAYRFHRTEEGVRRTIYSFFYNWFIRLMIKVRVRDINFSFKLFRREILQSLALKSNGSFIDAEMVGKVIHRGYKFVQFGADYFPRTIGVSKLSSFKVIRRILSELFEHRHEVLHGDPKAPPPVIRKNNTPVINP